MKLDFDTFLYIFQYKYYIDNKIIKYGTLKINTNEVVTTNNLKTFYVSLTKRIDSQYQTNREIYFSNTQYSSTYFFNKYFSLKIKNFFRNLCKPF